MGDHYGGGEEGPSSSDGRDAVSDRKRGKDVQVGRAVSPWHLYIGMSWSKSR